MYSRDCLEHFLLLITGDSWQNVFYLCCIKELMILKNNLTRGLVREETLCVGNG